MTWEELLAAGRYREIALRLIDCSDLDFDALRQNAFLVLQDSDEVQLIEQEDLTYGCGGGGYYRPQPPTIYLHHAIRRRDNFTLLHELCHHLQARHPEWAFVLLDVPRASRRHVEEKVCDQFAAEVLMPWDGTKVDPLRCHPADLMAGLYEQNEASRSAVLRRVKAMLPDSAKWIVAVADIDGRVQAADTTYSDSQPAKDSVQPGFAALASEADDGPIRRAFPEGIVYSTGKVLEDIRAEAALDYEGRYIFVATTPIDRFGTGRLVQQWYDCANQSCERNFTLTDSPGVCTKCSDPRCPDCNRCSCDPTDTGQTCLACNMRLSPGEIATGSHDCW